MISDKKFNDIIERLSRLWRKSFAETLRDLCTEAGIEFKLILKGEEKKAILRKIIEKEEAKMVIDEELLEVITRWVEK